MEKQEILDLALSRLEKVAGVKTAWHLHDNSPIDAELEIEIGGQQKVFQADIKKTVRGAHVAHVADSAHSHTSYMLVTESLTPLVKEALRGYGVAYLEGNGNVYIHDQGVYLWIDTQKPLPLKREKANRAFTKTGLKVVFLFLTMPDSLQETQRKIAALGGVGLGMVNNVFAGLKELGFLIEEKNGHRTLYRQRELIKKWVYAYEERLRPSLKMGRFRSRNAVMQNSWKQIELKPGKTAWGAEPAASLYTGYLTPGEWAIYTEENRNDLIKNYDWIPDPNGPIHAFRKFWKHGDHETVVPKLLAYADLVHHPDSRCREAAEKVLEGNEH